MNDNPGMQALLDKLLSSQDTPEDVCRSCPELLPEVRERWRQMSRVQAELDALFPAWPEPVTGSPALLEEGTALLRWARKDYPTDFWIHFHLGARLILDSGSSPLDFEEGLGCLRAKMGWRRLVTADPAPKEAYS